MQNEIKYKVTMKTESPFRIGGVKPISGTTDVDSPVSRLGNKVVVQGTSLKGALRHGIESRIIDAYFDKASGKWRFDGMKPCLPANENSATSDEKTLVSKSFYKYACSYPRPDDYICPVCYLLGARGLIGFVGVPFLKMIVGTVEPMQFIRSDRVVGTSAKGALAKFEAIPEDSRFEGVMTVMERDDIKGWVFGNKRLLVESKGDIWLDNSSWTKEKILSELLIGTINSIKKLGGFASKGFGDVELHATLT